MSFNHSCTWDNTRACCLYELKVIFLFLCFVVYDSWMMLRLHLIGIKHEHVRPGPLFYCPPAVSKLYLFFLHLVSSLRLSVAPGMSALLQMCCLTCLILKHACVQMIHMAPRRLRCKFLRLGLPASTGMGPYTLWICNGFYESAVQILRVI
jgi:hypothetical protein